MEWRCCTRVSAWLSWTGLLAGPVTYWSHVHVAVGVPQDELMCSTCCCPLPASSECAWTWLSPPLTLVWTLARQRAHGRARTRTCTCTRANTRTHTRTHTHTHTHTHIHTRAHAHTRTHVRTRTRTSRTHTHTRHKPGRRLPRRAAGVLDPCIPPDGERVPLNGRRGAAQPRLRRRIRAHGRVDGTRQRPAGAGGRGGARGIRAGRGRAGVDDDW